MSMDALRASYAFWAGVAFMAIAIGRACEVPRQRRPWGYLTPALGLAMGLLFLFIGLKFMA